MAKLEIALVLVPLDHIASRIKKRESQDDEGN